eukprot:scaffold44781_cov43-Phaeocystis_antarctica.AAC.3
MSAKPEAVLPAHAQRMTSLLLSDKAGVYCQGEGEDTRWARMRAAPTRQLRGSYAAATRQLYTWRRNSARWVTQHHLGGKAHAGRTSNMELMSVTLDTSKLSGWLNTFVSCRVTRRAMGVDMWGERREGRGAVAVQAACRDE